MGHRILLADDSLTIQKVVELTFAEADYELLAVGSGDRAVQALETFRPGIVLADVVMPGLSGYEVCMAVKSRPEGSHTPVILLTGTFEPFDRNRAERVGCDSIVTKPFDSHALAALVKELLEKAAAAKLSEATAKLSEARAELAEAAARLAETSAAATSRLDVVPPSAPVRPSAPPPIPPSAPAPPPAVRWGDRVPPPAEPASEPSFLYATAAFPIPGAAEFAELTRQAGFGALPVPVSPIAAQTVEPSPPPPPPAPVPPPILAPPLVQAVPEADPFVFPEGTVRIAIPRDLLQEVRSVPPPPPPEAPILEPHPVRFEEEIFPSGAAPAWRDEMRSRPPSPFQPTSFPPIPSEETETFGGDEPVHRDIEADIAAFERAAEERGPADEAERAAEVLEPSTWATPAPADLAGTPEEVEAVEAVEAEEVETLETHQVVEEVAISAKAREDSGEEVVVELFGAEPEEPVEAPARPFVSEPLPQETVGVPTADASEAPPYESSGEFFVEGLASAEPPPPPPVSRRFTVPEVTEVLDTGAFLRRSFEQRFDAAPALEKASEAAAEPIETLDVAEPTEPIETAAFLESPQAFDGFDTVAEAGSVPFEEPASADVWGSPKPTIEAPPSEVVPAEPAAFETAAAAFAVEGPLDIATEPIVGAPHEAGPLEIEPLEIAPIEVEIAPPAPGELPEELGAAELPEPMAVAATLAEGSQVSEISEISEISGIAEAPGPEPIVAPFVGASDVSAPAPLEDVEVPPSELEALAAEARRTEFSHLIPGAAQAHAVPTRAATLSNEEVDRIARRVIELLGERVVREIAWEVVPELAERLIRARIREIEPPE